MPRLLTCSALVALLFLSSKAAAPFDLFPLIDDPNGPRSVSHRSDDKALEEILRGTKGSRQQWTRVPELTVLQTVMEYQPGSDVQYRATADRLTDQEVAQLTKDLTSGLQVLTADTFNQFAAIHLRRLAESDTIGVSQPNQIVAGRFKGLQASLKTMICAPSRAASSILRQALSIVF